MSAVDASHAPADAEASQLPRLVAREREHASAALAAAGEPDRDVNSSRSGDWTVAAAASAAAAAGVNTASTASSSAAAVAAAAAACVSSSPVAAAAAASTSSTHPAPADALTIATTSQLTLATLPSAWLLDILESHLTDADVLCSLSVTCTRILAAVCSSYRLKMKCSLSLRRDC